MENTLLIILLIIMLIGIIVIIYSYKPPTREKLDVEDLQVLKNPAHLAATLYRVSNTILTSGNVFSDQMDKLPLPDSVKDNFNEWIEKGYVSSVKDQMLCGGCWAFATCSSLADRLTIATAGRWRAPFGLSEQVLISCGGENGMDFYQGCEGGIPSFAIDSLTKQGIPADKKCAECGGSSVQPAAEGGGGGGVVNPNTTSTCASGGNVYANTDYTYWQTGCNEGTSCSLSASSTCPCSQIVKEMERVADTQEPFDVKYKTVGEAHTYTAHGVNNELHTVDLWPDIPDAVIKQNVERMKKAIYYEGPITIGYRVTQDFYTWWPTANADNYYKYDGRSPMAGGHAVVIVGWKKMSDGTPVWIIKNSWGENGGYGFKQPVSEHPVTKEVKPTYRGGFWNHIMGENDSFVESNASGAHPYLHDPPIVNYLPNGGKDIPQNWYETMTLRDVMNLVSKGGPPQPSPPLPPPQPSPPPQPQPSPPQPSPSPPQPSPSPPQPSPTPVTPLVPIITSDKFKTITLTPQNISPQSLQKFFSTSGNLYIIGANDENVIKKVLKLLPDKENLTQDDIEELSEKVADSISGYLVIATKGAINNYYYMRGDPSDWNIFTSNANRAASLNKFVYDIYSALENLKTFAPIVQVIHKSDEKFYLTSAEGLTFIDSI